MLTVCKEDATMSRSSGREQICSMRIDEYMMSARKSLAVIYKKAEAVLTSLLCVCSRCGMIV